MKTIFKKIQLKGLLIGIISGVIVGGGIFGTLGIVATTNKLEAKYVMYTKDGETKTVQDAIKDLYVLAKNNGGGSSQTLPLGTISAEGYKITVPYTGSYQNIKCVYGPDESYGNEGTISGNTCTFTGTSSNQTLYYKIVGTNITSDTEGVVYKNSGSATTGASGVTIVKTGLPTGVKAIIYLDPTNLGTRCTASNSTSTTGTKSGCMKWYAFIEDDASYTMILDHNTYAIGTWANAKSKLTTLQSQTGWNNLNTRMITENEIATITGNTSFNSATSTSDKWFYLDSNTQTQTAKSQGASKFYWLFDYTYGCTSYGGCNVADSSNYGYWTSETVNGSSGGAWRVDYRGSLRDNGHDMGLRPVITVSKSNL